jgi:hypothetical protein
VVVSTHSPHRIIGRERDEPDVYKGPPGLRRWVRRNRWLLLRMVPVLIFGFVLAALPNNISYGLQGDPVRLTVEQINRGQLPPGVGPGSYVEVVGTPNFGPGTSRIGTPESKVATFTRYSSATYFYFGLKETDGNLLVQTAQTPPDITKNGERLWRGQLQTVGTVIFHDTSQGSLRAAGLPTDNSTLVLAIGDTPEFYRSVFPAYAAVIGLWLLCVGWLIWKKNKPLEGL